MSVPTEPVFFTKISSAESLLSIWGRRTDWRINEITSISSKNCKSVEKKIAGVHARAEQGTAFRETSNLVVFF